ncbi:autotransporter-associated beta strand repeat-containing protein, partial [Akkermansia sp. N21169]|uniref:autotransporter-associated beta strand repeat-containing protein n=1 Tax=Akkermansia sp. N21169 TaxID=3040765 RepID=UPI00244E7A2E
MKLRLPLLLLSAILTCYTNVHAETTAVWIGPDGDHTADAWNTLANWKDYVDQPKGPGINEDGQNGTYDPIEFDAAGVLSFTGLKFEGWTFRLELKNLTNLTLSGETKKIQGGGYLKVDQNSKLVWNILNNGQGSTGNDFSLDVQSFQGIEFQKSLTYSTKSLGTLTVSLGSVGSILSSSSAASLHANVSIKFTDTTLLQYGQEHFLTNVGQYGVKELAEGQTNYILYTRKLWDLSGNATSTGGTVAASGHSFTLNDSTSLTLSGSALSADADSANKFYVYRGGDGALYVDYVTSSTDVSNMFSTWTGATGTWNATNTNWHNSTGESIPFTQGSIALFTKDNSGTVTIDGEVNPLMMKFTGGSYTFNNKDAASKIITTGAVLISGDADQEPYVEFTGTNAITGSITIENGTLKLSHANAVTFGNISLRGGTVQLNASGFGDFKTVAGMNGTLLFDQGATMGKLTLGDGALTIAGNAAIGSLLLNGSGTLNGAEGSSQMIGSSTSAGSIALKNGTLDGMNIDLTGGVNGQGGTVTIKNSNLVISNYFHAGENGSGATVMSLENTNVIIKGSGENQGISYSLGLGDWHNADQMTVKGGKLLMQSNLLLTLDGASSLTLQDNTFFGAQGIIMSRENIKSTFVLNDGTVVLGSGGWTKHNPSAPTEINLQKGTIGASANWSSSLNMVLGDPDSEGIEEVIFDTAKYNIDSATYAYTQSNEGTTITLSGELSGEGKLVKKGEGTLVLSKDINKYTGGTDILGGTIVMGAAGSLSTKEITFDSKTGAAQLTLADVIGTTLTNEIKVLSGTNTIYHTKEDMVLSGPVTISKGAALQIGSLMQDTISIAELKGLGEFKIINSLRDTTLGGTNPDHGKEEAKGGWDYFVFLTGANAGYSGDVSIVDTKSESPDKVYGSQLVLGNSDALARSSVTLNGYSALNIQADSASIKGLSGDGWVSTYKDSTAGKTYKLTLTPDKDYSFSGIIQDGNMTGLGSGKLALEMNGTGSQKLTGENTYTGGTILTAGELRIEKEAALGNGGMVTFNGGTLVADDTLDIFSHTVTVNSGKSVHLAAVDGKTITLSTLQFSGTTNSNHVMAGLAGAKGTVVLGNLTNGGVLEGTLSVLGDVTLRLANDDDSGTVTVRHSSKNGTLDAIAGTLEKTDGTLRVELESDGSLSGRLKAEKGILELVGTGSSRSLLLTGTLEGDSMKLGANAAVTVGTDTQSGTISVDNVLTLDGGTLNLSNGTVAVKNVKALTGGSLNLSSGLVTVENVLTLDGGSLNLSGGTMETENLAFGTSASTSTLALLTGGQLTVGASGVTGSAGTLELGGGTLKSSAAWSTTHVAVLSATGSDATTIDTTGGDITLSGNLSNKSGVASVNLVKSGSGVLELGGGNASLSGNIKVTGGTLKAASSTAFGAASNEILTEGAKIDLNSQTLSNSLVFSGDSTLSGTSAGYAGAVHAKSGTLTLSDASAVLKDVRVLAGATLKGTNLSIGGTLTLDLSDMLTRNNSPYVQMVDPLGGTTSLKLDNFLRTTEDQAAGAYKLISVTGDSALDAGEFSWERKGVATDAYLYTLVTSVDGDTSNKNLYLRLARIGTWVWNSGNSGHTGSVWAGNVDGPWDQQGFQGGPDGQKVQFDDAASMKTVTISGTVSPWSLDIINSAGNDYIFQGEGSPNDGIGNYGELDVSLTKKGTGKLSLASNLKNTYSGGTYLYDGTIEMGNSNSLGTGIVDFLGGTLGNVAGTDVTITNVLTDAIPESAIGITDKQAIKLLAAPGTTLIVDHSSGGGLVFDDSGKNDAAVSISGTGLVQLSGLAADAKLSGTVSVSDESSLELVNAVQQGSVTLSGKLSGVAGTLEKTSGTLVLNLLNEGDTFGGTLKADALTVSAVGSTATDKSLGLSGTMSASGLILSDGAELKLLSGGKLTVDGTISVNSDSGLTLAGGTLTLGNAATSSATDVLGGTDGTVILGNGTLTAATGSSGWTASHAMTLSGTGENRTLVSLGDGQTVTLGGALSGDGLLTKQGGGTLVLGNGGNTVSGEIALKEGRLELADGASLGTSHVTVSGGTLELNDQNVGGATLTVTGGILSGASNYAPTGGVAVELTGQAAPVDLGGLDGSALTSIHLGAGASSGGLDYGSSITGLTGNISISGDGATPNVLLTAGSGNALIGGSSGSAQSLISFETPGASHQVYLGDMQINLTDGLLEELHDLRAEGTTILLQLTDGALAVTDPLTRTANGISDAAHAWLSSIRFNPVLEYLGYAVRRNLDADALQANLDAGRLAVTAGGEIYYATDAALDGNAQHRVDLTKEATSQDPSTTHYVYFDAYKMVMINADLNVVMSGAPGDASTLGLHVENLSGGLNSATGERYTLEFENNLGTDSVARVELVNGSYNGRNLDTVYEGNLKAGIVDFVKTGTGSLTINGDVTIDGGIETREGTLVLNGHNSLESLTAGTGDGLTVIGGETLVKGVYGQGGTLELRGVDSRLVVTGSDTMDLATHITGDGTFSMAYGTLRLVDGGDFSSDSTLELQSGSVLDVAGGNDVTVGLLTGAGIVRFNGTGSTLTVKSDRDSNLSIAFEGRGTLAKEGRGTQTLGVASKDLSLAVREGTLVLSAHDGNYDRVTVGTGNGKATLRLAEDILINSLTVGTHGRLTLNSGENRPGILSCAGNVDLQSGSTLDLVLPNPIASIDADGHIALGDGVTLNLVNGSRDGSWKPSDT